MGCNFLDVDWQKFRQEISQGARSLLIWCTGCEVIKQRLLYVQRYRTVMINRRHDDISSSCSKAVCAMEKNLPPTFCFIIQDQIARPRVMLQSSTVNLRIVFFVVLVFFAVLKVIVKLTFLIYELCVSEAKLLKVSVWLCTEMPALWALNSALTAAPQLFLLLCGFTPITERSDTLQRLHLWACSLISKHSHLQG